MKREDIKVGGEYYWDSSKEWQSARGLRNAARAVVLNDKRYIWDRLSHRWRESPKGSRVMVATFRRDGTPTGKTAVPVAHLRGPWSETLAEVQKMAAEEQRRERAISLHRQQLRAVADEADAACELIGVHTLYGGEGAVCVNGAELLAMALHLESIGWRYGEGKA